MRSYDTLFTCAIFLGLIFPSYGEKPYNAPPVGYFCLDHFSGWSRDRNKLPGIYKGLPKMSHWLTGLP